MNRRDLTISGIEPPEWCDKLLRPFGVNPFGESIFRVIWAPRKLSLLGGYWSDNGVFGYRLIQKYKHQNYWMLERWLPCKHYGPPQQWISDTTNGEGYLSIGPYPTFGVYETGCSFATKKYGFVPLLPDLVLLTVQGMWCGRIRTTTDIRDAILNEEKFKEELNDKELERQWDMAHGVRRGTSFSSSEVIQNNAAEIELYKQRMVASGVRVMRDDFTPGFQQY